MNLAMEVIDRLLETAAPAPITIPTRPSAPPAPSKPRPGTRPWKPTQRPGVAPKPKARAKDRDEEVAFAEAAGGGEVAVPPPPEDTGGPEPVSMETAVDKIQRGDRVTIVTPQGQQVSGSAVMPNREMGSWVLNLGGAHGRPGVATNKNIVKVTRRGTNVYSRM